MLIHVDTVIKLLVPFPSSALSINGRRQTQRALSVSSFELSVVKNHWKSLHMAGAVQSGRISVLGTV